MKASYLIAAVILLALSLSCIITTAVEIIQGTYGMATARFWGAVIFHAVTAVVAVCLLAKARREKSKQGKGCHL